MRKFVSQVRPLTFEDLTHLREVVVKNLGGLLAKLCKKICMQMNFPLESNEDESHSALHIK